MAIIKDEKLFSILENHAKELINTKFQTDYADTVINLAVSDMVNELTPNLWEKNLERAVDYGHSFSPIIEMKNLPNLFHGEAVVLDCLFSACLSLIRKHITQDELDRIFKTARNLKLPTYHKDFVDVNTLKLALSDTIKHRNGNQYLPVPLSIGNNAILNNVTGEEIYLTITIFQNYENSRNNRNI
jgi:3-dehydroquinate synthase